MKQTILSLSMAAPRTLGQAFLGLLLLPLATAGLATGSSGNVSAAPPVSYPIEAKYKVPGSWAVSKSTVTDSSGNVVYQLFYPTNLGANAFSHPVLTWGNGTNGTPDNYPGVLNHLATWGFVVVASTDPTTATGAEMLAGVDYMSAQNSDPASIFYTKLNLNAVGALGHSQGAGGAVNAANKSSMIKTSVPINLPDYKWVDEGGGFSVSELSVPAFFLGASGDKFVAPPTTTVGYYNQTPGTAAIGVLKGASHNTIQRSGGGYLGYLTAWMMYQLQGDTYARGAFVGTLLIQPEMNVHTGWQNTAQKFLL